MGKKARGYTRSGKSRASERHLFPPDDNAPHITDPWCRCQPNRRIAKHSTLYIHNPFRSEEDMYETASDDRP